MAERRRIRNRILLTKPFGERTIDLTVKKQ